MYDMQLSNIETAGGKMKTLCDQINEAIEIYKANSNSNIYPVALNDLASGTVADVSNKTFIDRMPIDPFYRSRTTAYTTGTLDPNETAVARDGKIGVGGGWAYESTNGRICPNYKSTDTVPGVPTDTSWGSAYNIW